MKNSKFAKFSKLSSSRAAILVAILLAAIVLIAAVIGIIVSSDEEDVPTEPTDVSADIQTVATEMTEVTSEPTQESTEPTAVTEATSEPTAPIVPPSPPRPTTPPKTVITLPYTIPGTSLVIQRVANYDGIYLEDGTNSDITDVAMMLLYNSGTEPVEYANCTLVYDDKTLQFIASAIPAGGRVAVQEATKESCASGDLTLCTVDIALMDKMDMSEGSVKVEDNGDNSLTVTNLTEQDIVTVRIFYKYYLADEDAYVGGIAFSAKLSNLKAGESVVVTPTHYASDGSVIVMVRTYDVDA